jgi:hypothetical protein
VKVEKIETPPKKDEEFTLDMERLSGPGREHIKKMALVLLSYQKSHERNREGPGSEEEEMKEMTE